MLDELRQLAVAEESTEGTAATIDNSTSNYLVRNISFKEEIANFEREVRSAYFSQFPSIQGSRMGTLSFEMDAYGQPGATTAPHFETLYRACGLLKASTGSTTNAFSYTSSSTWDPMTMGSSNHKSLTMAFILDGLGFKIVGARGNARFIFRAGQPLAIGFTFQGALVDTADTAFLTPTYATNSSTPAIFAGATVTLGGLSATEGVIEQLEIDLGNTLYMRPDANSSSGYRSCAITSRRPVLTFDPELLKVAQGFDFYSTWKAGTTMALSIAFGTTTSKITVTAPAVQFTDQSLGARGGIATKQCTGALRRSAGDDEFVLTHGVAT